MNQLQHLPAQPETATARRGEMALDLPLRHGGRACGALRYELVGSDDAPLLLVAGGISAGRHVVATVDVPEPGWWQALACSFDRARFRLLAIDWIGADGSLDLAIDPADQAAALQRLLDRLGVSRIAGFIGASYGGMVGMHFAAGAPHRVGALLAISAPASAHPFSSAARALQRQAIALGEAHGDPAAGVALARALAMLSYRTPEEFADRFTATPAVHDGRLRVAAEDYLAVQGARHAERMPATAYRRLSESIDLHRVDPAAITVPLTLVAVDSDALVPAADIAALADAHGAARLHRIASRFGHDAFLKEERAIAAILAEFLSTLETDR